MENSLRTASRLVVYEGVGNPIKSGFAFSLWGAAARWILWAYKLSDRDKLQIID